MSEQTIASAGFDNPWRGLAAYTEQQHDLFFGRDSEIAEVLRLIERETLTVVFGRSGLGKTSLIRAGVMPRLGPDVYLPVLIRLDYSNRDLGAADQVKEITRQAAAAAGVEIEAAAAPDATLWEFFHNGEFWGPRNDKVIPLLIFDQFEEVFTVGREGQQTAAFLEQLADLIENRIPLAVRRRIEASAEKLGVETGSPNYKVLISLREDFVPRLDSLRPILPAIMRNRFALQPLDSRRALQVIDGAGGRWVSPEVAREIVAIVSGHQGGNGALHDEIEPAYLSVMCHELFRRMVALGRDSITSDLVTQEQGGILEALYDRSLEGMGSGVREFVENRLLTASGFRGTVPLSEAAAEGIAPDDLDRLVDRRLLRFEDRLGTRHVELSHDLLTGVVRKSRDQRRARAAAIEEERKRAQLRRELRRSRRRAVAALAVAVATVATALFVYAAEFRRTESYYKAFSKRLGYPTPYGPLTGEAVRHRPVSFKVIRKGFRGSIVAMEAVDSAGKLTLENSVRTYFDSDAQGSSPKACRWEYVYDDHGRVVYETAWDDHGRMKWGFVYAPISDPSARVRKATFVGPDGMPMPQRNTHAEVVELHYDRNGYEIERRYLDRNGEPAPGPDNAFGKRLDYDAAGRQIKDTSLDATGKPVNDSAGNASLAVEFDRDGNEITATALDADGNKTLFGSRGRSVSRYRYDPWGNLIESSFFDTNDLPVIDREEGSHLVKTKRDQNGNAVEIANFDTHGVAMDRQASFSYHRIEMVYDSENRLVRQSYFGKAGQRVAGTAGWHEFRNTYDANGFVSQETLYSTELKPVNTWYGYATLQFQNDATGNHLESRYLDGDGKPAVLRDDNYHHRRSRYNERGWLIEESYYDIHEQPCLNATTGVHRLTKTYDRFGNPRVVRDFGIDGAPANSKQGFQREESLYNEFGQITETRYYAPDGKRATYSGVHWKRYFYDERGLLADVKHYDTAERPVEDQQGIATIRYGYNTKRQQTLIAYFGLKGPVKGPEGAQRIETEYDAAGRQLKVARWDAEGKQLSEETGAAKPRYAYDSLGHVIEESYFDEQGNPKANADGYASVRYERDKEGHPLVTRIFGSDGKPVLSRTCCATIRREYDHQGRQIREAYFDLDDHPMPDRSGKSGSGVASWRRQYGTKGEIEMLSYFGTSGAPVESVFGYAKYQVFNDAEGKLIETDMWDRSGLVVRAINGGDAIPGEASMPYLRSLKKKAIPVVTGLTGDNDSIAKRIRLHAGDVVLDYDGESYDGRTMQSLSEWFKRFPEGPDRMRTLGILRNGQRMTFQVPKGELKVNFKKAKLGRAFPPAVEASVVRGNGLLGKKDYAAAASLYREAAGAGSPDAMLQLGMMAQSGYGMRSDIGEAVKLYRQGAEAGNDDAMMLLATVEAYTTTPRNYEDAMNWFLKAADLGNPTALRGIGLLYARGLGVTQDYGEARKWFLKAADVGEPWSMDDLGGLYAGGRGVPQDHGEAAKWYRKSADGGNSNGSYDLGVAYEQGRGLPQDVVEAVKWYRKAADLGHAGAMNNLAYQYEHGRGVPTDYPEALKWYRKAADLGNAAAADNIGGMYAAGRGVPQDYGEAIKWYRKAADQGNRIAMNNVGSYYENGRGVTPDYGEAMNWYRKSAEAGNSTAMNSIGRLYENGRGVKADQGQAIEWYQKAAAAGNDTAKENLRRLGK
jgi:TPR repeat protein